MKKPCQFFKLLLPNPGELIIMLLIQRIPLFIVLQVIDSCKTFKMAANESFAYIT